MASDGRPPGHRPAHSQLVTRDYRITRERDRVKIETLDYHAEPLWLAADDLAALGLTFTHEDEPSPPPRPRKRRRRRSGPGTTSGRPVDPEP